MAGDLELVRGLQRLVQGAQRHIEFGNLRSQLVIALANLAADLSEFDQRVDISSFDLVGRIREIGALAEQYAGIRPAQAQEQQSMPGYNLRDALARADRGEQHPGLGYAGLAAPGYSDPPPQAPPVQPAQQQYAPPPPYPAQNRR